MKSQARAATVQTTPINLYCVQEGEGWRVHARPAGLPRFLRQHFDENWEAYPVWLDFEELDRRLSKSGESCDKRVSTLGGVELTGRGKGALIIAEWLSTAFASGVQLRK